MQDDIRRVMARELEAFAREVELFPDDAALWRTVPGVANSAGNLALHVCGNLKHFVGAVLGGSGYVRNREAEFATRSGRREDVARQVRDSGRRLRSSVTRDGPRAPTRRPTTGSAACDTFFAALSVHLAFHLGQAGYLRRALTGDARTSGAVSLAALARPDRG
jgi:hypothetical protein